ncbi:MAG: anaerobic sulfatase maturase, partial [Chitinivibrionales bacterium]|nr:anaerobic sulfatase maturase [Chitinivibrionales bacterium]
KKERLYPGSSFRMADEVMESYIRQTLEAQDAPLATIAWQGGEPTLMGLDFFRRTIEVERRYAKPAVKVERTLQTNGVLLDDRWCEFLREHAFLVGLSLDGPRELHDAYRRDRGGKSVFSRVTRAARLLQRHGVEYNILCTVNAVNSRRPLDVYRFFRDELGARYVQFIPIVERDNDSGYQDGNTVTTRSVRPEQYGRFLTAIFDEWVTHDVGTMFVQMFDGTLAAWVRGISTLCIFRPTCGEGVALEHNGDLYSCDHFVEPRHRLGNIMETPLRELVVSEQQRAFADAKHVGLPHCCRECRYLFACNGECPKNRVATAPNGEPNLNYLCTGLRDYFRHTEQSMRIMAHLLRQGRPAADIMHMRPPRTTAATVPGAPGRNTPCPCGSGRKYKQCCLKAGSGRLSA